MKPEEKWNGTVIEVLTREHGKKVIDWWKEQGVDTMRFIGDSTKEDNDSDRYYGLIDRRFGTHSIESIEKYKAKIITLPEPFPERWYMKITDENREVANEWRRSVANYMISENLRRGSYLLSKCPYDDSFFSNGNVPCDNRFKGYSPITFEQFKEHVLKQSSKMKIKPEQAQGIIDMISPSCKWKERLLDLWAKSIVLKQEIEVSEELLQEGRKEASTSQIKVLDRIFGKEKEEIELSSGQGLNGKELFNKGLNTEQRFLISIYGGKGKSFYLNSNFKWTLTGNVLTVSHKDA